LYNQSKQATEVWKHAFNFSLIQTYFNIHVWVLEHIILLYRKRARAIKTMVKNMKKGFSLLEN